MKTLLRMLFILLSYTFNLFRSCIKTSDAEVADFIREVVTNETFGFKEMLDLEDNNMPEIVINNVCADRRISIDWNDYKTDSISGLVEIKIFPTRDIDSLEIYKVKAFKDNNNSVLDAKLSMVEQLFHDMVARSMYLKYTGYLYGPEGTKRIYTMSDAKAKRLYRQFVKKNMFKLFLLALAPNLFKKGFNK